MTDSVTEYMVVSLTSAAVGSFLTLLTCWGCGMFDPRSDWEIEVEAYTAGMQEALNLQHEAETEAEYTEHSPQLEAK